MDLCFDQKQIQYFVVIEWINQESIVQYHLTEDPSLHSEALDRWRETSESWLVDATEQETSLARAIFLGGSIPDVARSLM